MFATFANVSRAFVSAVLGSALILGAAGTALAGPFGGFSRDGSRYLVGQDKVCQPVTAPDQAPACEKASAEKVAELRFRKGELQSGAKAVYRARASASSIEVSGDAGAVFTWKAPGPVSKVTAVYAETKLGVVAIEFQTRLGSRTVEEAIAVRVGGAQTGAQIEEGTGSVKVGQDPSGAKKKPVAPPPKPKDDPKLRAAIDDGRKLAKKRKHAEAIARYDQALAIVPDHPEPRYWRAVSRLALGKTADAVADLTAIRDAAHPQAPEWMIEARFAKEFAKLRADAAFRAAVGLDGGNRERSAFERLVGLGGQWEQPPIPCEEPRVNLKLDRDAKRRFELVITSKCGDGVDKTRLTGTWRSTGSSELQLTFPNQGDQDEGMVCKLEVCRDSSREDCVRCQPEPDLEFLLRVVRR